MSNKSDRLLVSVAEEISRKYVDAPCYKLSGTYDVPLRVSLISDIIVWYRGRKNCKQERK